MCDLPQLGLSQIPILQFLTFFLQGVPIVFSITANTLIRHIIDRCNKTVGLCLLFLKIAPIILKICSMPGSNYYSQYYANILGSGLASIQWNLSIMDTIGN